MKRRAEPKIVPLKSVLAGFFGGVIILAVLVIVAMIVGGTWAGFVFALRGGKSLSVPSTLIVGFSICAIQTQPLCPPYPGGRAYVVAASTP